MGLFESLRARVILRDIWWASAPCAIYEVTLPRKPLAPSARVLLLGVLDPSGDKRDLRDVLREERSRGRKPVHTDAEREQNALREGLLELIEGDDEAKFGQALTALGYQSDSERFRHFVEVWRSLRRRRA